MKGGQALDPVFPGRDCPRPNRKAIGRILNQHCLDSGVPRFTAHALRHTFGTEAASAGIPVTELQDLMGHEDLFTTQRYVRVIGWDLERAIAQLKARRDARDLVAPKLKCVRHPRSRVQSGSAEPGQKPAYRPSPAISHRDELFLSFQMCQAASAGLSGPIRLGRTKV